MKDFGKDLYGIFGFQMRKESKFMLEMETFWFDNSELSLV